MEFNNFVFNFFFRKHIEWRLTGVVLRPYHPYSNENIEFPFYLFMSTFLGNYSSCVCKPLDALAQGEHYEFYLKVRLLLVVVFLEC